jgi:hypothetical protein
MKKAIITILFSGVSYLAFSQKPENVKSEGLLKELSEKACKCVENIETKNKPKDEVTKKLEVV